MLGELHSDFVTVTAEQMAGERSAARHRGRGEVHSDAGVQQRGAQDQCDDHQDESDQRPDEHGGLLGRRPDGPAEGDGRGLSRKETRDQLVTLFLAGHETTSSLIGIMFFRLAQRPDLLEQLHDRPELIETAVEEFLRFDSPVQGLFRAAADDTELGEVAIPAGAKVQLLYASANRDPAVWDDPDELRFDRDPGRLRKHLAFGWGVHHCLGASLARLEGRLVLSRMVRDLATLELVEPPVPTSAFLLRGFEHVVVRWTPRPADRPR